MALASTLHAATCNKEFRTLPVTEDMTRSVRERDAIAKAQRILSACEKFLVENGLPVRKADPAQFSPGGKAMTFDEVRALKRAA